MDRSADRAAPDWRLTRPLMPSDQENDPIAARDCLLERSVDRPPGAIETQSVKVDSPVGLKSAATKAAVPRTIERCSKAPRPLRSDGRASGARFCRLWLLEIFRRGFNHFLVVRVARKRADRGSDARPERRFFRAERAHGPPRLWAGANRRRRSPPFRPRFGWLQGPSPKRCRSDWRP